MRIAVVGLGTAGADLHLAALAGLEGAETVGVFDVDAARTAVVAARFQVRGFTAFPAMLAEAQPEVVIVATPPETHVEYCVASLEAGAHVLCEKPFAPSVAEADRVLEAAARAGRQVALNHEFREMPIFRTLRDRVGTPGVGDLVSLQLWQLMDLPPWAERGWRSGMPAWSFFEGGIHLVDYALAVFGEKPVAVWATMSTCGVGERASDAVTAATLEFSRGRLAHIVQNRLCRGETQYFEARIDCRDASLRGSFGGRVRLSAGLHRSTRPHVRFEVGASGIAWLETGHARRIIGRNPRNPPMVATRLLLERTLEAFRSGGTPPASGAAGRDGIEVLAACYRSAETGERVVLDGPHAKALATAQLGTVPAGGGERGGESHRGTPVRLSVVVTIVEGGAALHRCLSALAQQERAPELEVLVPYDETVTDIDAYRSRYPGFRFLAVGHLDTDHDPRSLAGQHELFDMRRARGLAAATGDIVAMLEDRGVPRPDWAAALAKAHERPVPAVGGAVENGKPRLLNWAVYFCDFGRYQLPVPEGPAEYITDVNLSYKREALERTREHWEGRYHETTVHWSLQRDGDVLWLTPSFVVDQIRDGLRLGSMLAERYYWARLFAYTRAREATLARRLIFTAASPLLPFLLFLRHLRQRFEKRRSLGAFLLAAPVTFALLVAWSLGEMVGYVTGRE